MVERSLHIAHTLCPDPRNLAAEKPFHVTLLVTAVNGVREGAPEVVCPVLVEGRCLSGSVEETIAMYQSSTADIGHGTAPAKAIVSSFPECMQLNPQ